MTVTPAPLATGPAGPGGHGRDDAAGAEALERLQALLDPEFLKAAGWDPVTQVLTPPPEHSMLGYPVCIVAGCRTISHSRSGLCATCSSRYRHSSMDLAAFVAAGPAKTRVFGQHLCAVPGCQRTRKVGRRGLCAAHEHQHHRHPELSLEEFVAHPDARALPGFGHCRVACCPRLADTKRGLCRTHASRWINELRRHQLRRDVDQPPDFDAWCALEQPVGEGPSAILGGMPALVQVQLLYGLQWRTKGGYKTRLHAIRSLCRVLRTSGAASILDVDLAAAPAGGRELAHTTQVALSRAFRTPELERHNDVWDMAVFGLGKTATIDFTIISQDWLRAAAKRWVLEELPTRRGPGVASTLRDHINSLAKLSDSLRLHRDDHGANPARLGRADVVSFTNRLAHLERTGAMSEWRRMIHARQVARLLREFRDLGLTRPGELLARLPDDFTLRRGDVPKEPDYDPPGRALPAGVLRQLLVALPALEALAGREVRVVVQLLIDTGRRPTEICALPWNCLERDADGKHTLVYTDFKGNRHGRRLPLNNATAALIIEQQQHVRARFPTTPLDELVLLPRAKRNLGGTKPVPHQKVGGRHREWVQALPALLTEDGTEFPKSAVFLYAYRHSFAQRHADAGTPVDALCELMGHDTMDTTRGYYKVTVKRTRAAVDKLAAFHFDAHGSRVWSQAHALLEHEHQRLAVGKVAVPFGTCSEPSNVKAGGGACPFRFRCLGCGHFRTDPSYLPELRAYLETLLRTRERVHAAAELDEWARAEALPSEEEITRLRGLIRRIEASLEDLSDDERGQIDQATQVLRTTRQTVHLGMPTLGPSDPEPGPTLQQPA